MLAGYEQRLDQFKAIGVSIIAGSVDTEEQTLEVSRDLSFPVAWGMTREDAGAIGAWWEERRNHIQPAEFLLTHKGRVLSSNYSSSPVGRMDPQETLTLAGALAARSMG